MNLLPKTLETLAPGPRAVAVLREVMADKGDSTGVRRRTSYLHRIEADLVTINASKQHIETVQQARQYVGSRTIGMMRTMLSPVYQSLKHLA